MIWLHWLVDREFHNEHDWNVQIIVVADGAQCRQILRRLIVLFNWHIFHNPRRLSGREKQSLFVSFEKGSSKGKLLKNMVPKKTQKLWWSGMKRGRDEAFICGTDSKIRKLFLSTLFMFHTTAPTINFQFLIISRVIMLAFLSRQGRWKNERHDGNKMNTIV